MKVFLKDDHDEALKVWRKEGIKNLDLIHVDAHIDFVMHRARQPQELLSQATSVEELKQNLEYTLSFLEYEKNLEKQTDIGNYIYPAIRDGIVKNFWWVIPGNIKSFEKNIKLIKKIFIHSFLGQKIRFIKKAKGLISVNAWGREFWACTLETLPIFTQPVLLDIDIDFMVVKDLSLAANTCDIAKRKPWIIPQELKNRLNLKVKNPLITTIVYSTNGGYTPMVYRYLGDELAYGFDEKKFSKIITVKREAAESFRRFQLSGNKHNYHQASRLDHAYKNEDNNYGQLYLLKNKLDNAEEEFKKVLNVDPHNAPALRNMGIVNFRRKNYHEALIYFKKARRYNKNNKVHRSEIIFAISLIYFHMNMIDHSEKLLKIHLKYNPLHPQTYYYLGRISDIRNDYSDAAKNYQNVLRLGFAGWDIFKRLYSTSLRLGTKEKTAIMKFIQRHCDYLRQTQKNNKRLMNKIITTMAMIKGE